MPQTPGRGWCRVTGCRERDLPPREPFFFTLDLYPTGLYNHAIAQDPRIFLRRHFFDQPPLLRLRVLVTIEAINPVVFVRTPAPPAQRDSIKGTWLTR